MKKERKRRKVLPPPPHTPNRNPALISSWFSRVSKCGCSAEAKILLSDPANFWFSDTTSVSHQQWKHWGPEGLKSCFQPSHPALQSGCNCTSLQEEVTVLSLRVSSLKTDCPETSGQSYPTPDMGWLWGAGPPQLFSSTWGECPHHPMTIFRHLFHGSAGGRGGVGCMALRCLPGFVCLLAESPCSPCRAPDAAVNLHHQQLQTSCFKSKQRIQRSQWGVFSPNEKGTIFCWISKYQHLEASESTLRSCCVSSLPREVLLLPICLTQSSTASECAADDGLVINVRSQVITWL